MCGVRCSVTSYVAGARAPSWRRSTPEPSSERCREDHGEATLRRNTNIFEGLVRATDDQVPYSENLIHRTTARRLVRSKSELVIANLLEGMPLKYEYERVCEAPVAAGKPPPPTSPSSPTTGTS
jgi:hypothetical protein